MMSGINLFVVPVELILKDVKHLFKTEVTYIIVGPTHRLKSILLWDYQLQFVVIPSNLINMLIQNPFSQTKTSPVASDIALAHMTSLHHFHCFQLLIFHPSNYLVDGGICLIGPESSQ